MKKRTPALVALFILSTFLMGLSELTDQFPAGARPYILAGSVLGMSIATALGLPTGKIKLRGRKSSAALAVVLSLSLISAACGAGTLQIVQRASEEVASSLAGAGSLINAFALSGDITVETATEKRAAFARLSEKFQVLNGAIQTVQKIDATTALSLLPAAEGFAAQLAAENLIPEAPPAIQQRFALVRAVLEIVIQRIINRLRSRSASVAAIRREVKEFARDARQVKELLAA